MTENQFARITIRVTPHAKRNAIEGWVDNALHVRVTPPAVDGRANKALIRLLAKSLAIAPGRIAIAAGHQSRIKRLVIEGIDEEELRQRLG